MAQFLAPILNTQIENSNGAPLSGGTVEVYLAGTSTPSTTYSDKAGLVPNTWPIVLNTLGLNNQGAVWLTGGFAYKFIVKDSTGIVQRTIDNVSGINDSAATVDQWVVFGGAPTFVSTTSFTVAGDQTQIFQSGRRIKTTNTGGTIYSTILSSAYSAPNTTVSVSNDSGVLDSGLSAVSYGLLSVSDSSLPGAFRMGQCRLVKSGANIVLQPYQGNQITINGATLRIPSAGVSLAPTGLTVSTLYYIYLAVVAGVLVLEASTTGHSTDATTGVEIKTGDPTRTLVGMARPVAGPLWQDTTNQRFVISWFNRHPIATLAAFTAARTVAAGGAYAEVNAEIRNEFLTWAETVSMSFDGAVVNASANGLVNTGIGLDGVASLLDAWSRFQAYAAGATGPAACTGSFAATEGYHFTTIAGASSIGVGTWDLAANAAGSRCTLKGVIQG